MTERSPRIPGGPEDLPEAVPPEPASEADEATAFAVLERRLSERLRDSDHDSPASALSKAALQVIRANRRVREVFVTGAMLFNERADISGVHLAAAAEDSPAHATIFQAGELATLAAKQGGLVSEMIGALRAAEDDFESAHKNAWDAERAKVCQMAKHYAEDPTDPSG